uniref:hypothetical protein n=1 Tax=Amycolatopsis sp. CA-096443 TaxID=3239919 RepID=UPI003F490EDB
MPDIPQSATRQRLGLARGDATQVRVDEAAGLLWTRGIADTRTNPGRDPWVPRHRRKTGRVAAQRAAWQHTPPGDAREPE